MKNAILSLFSIAALAACSVVIALALAGTVHAAEPVRPTLDFTAIKLEVTWVSSRAELEAHRREHGHARRPDAGRPTRLNGFSVLGRRDGELVCLVYALKPARVNDERTMALGHEVLHCLTGEYHR